MFLLSYRAPGGRSFSDFFRCPKSVRAVSHSADHVPNGSPTTSDQSLLRRFRMGEQEAAAEIYRRYAPRLHAIAHRQCSGSLATRVDADDIVQSVFWEFFEGARNGLYDVPAGDDLWRLILVIALNKVRAKRVFHQAAKRDVRLTASADCLQSQWNPQDVPALLLQLAFHDALAHLNRPQRKIVDLLLEGHKVAEIAEKVGRSKRTVERNLQEIRQKLRRLLEGIASHAQ